MAQHSVHALRGAGVGALAMDKQAAKTVFAGAGLPVAAGAVVGIAIETLEAADPMALPYVIKPLNEGSSVGVEILLKGDNRRAEIARKWRFGPEAMVEEYIPGREITVGVMGDRALAVTEIRAEAGAFYDYESKYSAGGSRHQIPAAIHPDTYARALDVAVAAHRALGVPRCVEPGGFSARRKRGRAGAAGPARGQHAARADADEPVAGTGGVSGDRVSRAVQLDGGARCMPRVDPRTDIRPDSGAHPGARLRTPAKAPPPLHARRPSRMRLFWRRRNKLMLPGLIASGVLLAVIVLLGASVVRIVSGRATAWLGCRSGWGLGSTLTVVQDIRFEGRDEDAGEFPAGGIGRVRSATSCWGFRSRMRVVRIEKLTWVQHATVERHLPGTILVRLEERRPFAVWQNGGKFQLIDRSGDVVVQQDPAKDADAFKTLPLVVGAGAPEAVAPLLDDLAALPALRARVVAAVRVGERRWNLHLNNGADVLLPEGAESAAMTRLMELQTSQALLDRPLQVVDMRLADRLVVRPAATVASGQLGKRPS